MYYPAKIIKVDGKTIAVFRDIQGIEAKSGKFTLENPSVRIENQDRFLEEIVKGFEGWTEYALAYRYDSFPLPSQAVDDEMLIPISAVSIQNIERINEQGSHRGK